MRVSLERIGITSIAPYLIVRWQTLGWEKPKPSKIEVVWP